MEILFLKNVIQKSWSAKFFPVLPKLGARSPLMALCCHVSLEWTINHISNDSATTHTPVYRPMLYKEDTVYN